MTDHLLPANATAPSGEQLHQTLAKVERMLGEMRARDLGAPRAAAEAELGEAQRCEWRAWPEGQGWAPGVTAQVTVPVPGLFQCWPACRSS